MPLEFRCPSCDRILRTPDESAGKKARCPQCAAIVDIPLTSQPLDGDGGPGTGGSFSDPSPAPSPGSLGAGSSEFGAGSAPLPSSTRAPFGGAAAPANPFADAGAGGDFGAPRSPAKDANPYATPAAGSFAAGPGIDGGAQPLADLVPSKIDLGELLQTTWDLCSKQFGMALVVGLIYMGINGALSVVSNILVQVGVASGETALVIVTQGLSQFISFFAQTWLQYGLAFVSLRWARTGVPQAGDFFAIGPYYLRALGVTLVTYLIFGLIAAVFAGIPAGVGALIGGKPEHALIGALGGGLLFGVPIMTYVGLTLYLAAFFLLDRQAGVFESISLSNRFMSGNRLAIFLAMLVVGVAGSMVVVLTCCIGSIAVVPFGGLLTAVAYLKITGQPMFQPSVVGVVKS